MTILLYDLAGADERVRFSPYCWRVKMALRHKGLDFETVPWRFTDKSEIAFTGQGLVPVLKDGPTVVHDSWEIARYLEVAYADRPSLFGGEAAQTQMLFLRYWCEQTLHPLLLRLILTDIHAQAAAKDREYFRASREARFGTTLEEFASRPVEALTAFRGALAPVRAVVSRNPYFGGNAPMFSDYMVFAHFQCARAVSRIGLVDPDDPVFAWNERMLGAFDDFARDAPIAPR